ncbi:MAG: bifunctional diaminohydroxyphosphoribosylaminopyrimidine [Bacteroidota bacterium]
MQRCLDLAILGQGTVSPNPMVGCVIVKDEQIIGEGYHQLFGGPHAEVNAIATVQNEQLIEGSTVYVSLEPCSHYGKTPPCSNLLIEKKVAKVVIACKDPNPKVAGKGIERLQKAGIAVEVGVLEGAAKQLNKRFFCFHEKQRPYVVLKWAQTKDGFLDRLRNQEQKGINWISSEESRSLVHHWRTTIPLLLLETSVAKIQSAFSSIANFRCKMTSVFSLKMPLHLFSIASKTNKKAISNGLKFQKHLPKIFWKNYTNGEFTR